MLKVFSMLCSAALLVTAPTPTFAGKILVVGDSYGGFAQCGPTGGVDGVSGGFIQEFCANQTVVNLAVSGSTAYQWGDGNTLNIQDKFTEAGTGVTHVWYTIGGNDFMTPQEDPGAPGSSAGACEISKADLLARFRPMLTKALAARDATGNSGAKFIFTGYCLPKSPGPCPGGTFNKNVLTEVYQTLASENPNDVEYINIWDKCLGSGNAANSDPEFFADIIHLNKRGYCQVFTSAEVTTALGCASRTYDCCQQPQTSCKADGYQGNYECKINGGYVPGSTGGNGGAPTLPIVISVVAAVLVFAMFGAGWVMLRGGKAKEGGNESV